MTKEYITIEKKLELENEMETLKTGKRQDIANALEYAKSLGDLSENAEYHQAREDQARLEDRIAEVEYILKNAEITERHHAGIVEVGAVVHVKKKGARTEQVFTIVGSAESDAPNAKISNESPLGAALLGKKPGETAVFMSPKGEEISYTVSSIE